MENAAFSPPNILIVDDVNANLAILTEIVRKSGYIARPVASAHQAVSAIEAMTPHLILLDVSMPEIDGFVLCSMLKKNANTRDIPVIFISALNSVEDKIKGFKLGAVDFITKPFDVEEVSLRIEAHLKMYKMQQELEAYNKKLYKIINDQIIKLNEANKNVVRALAEIPALRSPELDHYFAILGDNCRILALSLQLSSKFKEQITNTFIDVIDSAAAIHDIGMSLVLHKYEKGELVVSSREEIQQHTIVGAKALENVYALGGNNEYIKMAIDITKYHHERWDGKGYPFGISGKDIPLSARIVSVISTYQVYNPETRMDSSPEAGVERVRLGSGTKFDPDIVEVFMKIYNQFKR